MAVRTKSSLTIRTTLTSTMATRLPAINATNVTTVSPVSKWAPLPLDDEDEFSGDMHDWGGVHEFVKALYVSNIVMAFILSTVGLLFMATLLNRELRSKPGMWYLYHLLPICLLIGFILHPMTFFGTFRESQSACYFVMYTAEYAFFGIGINLIVFNLEIYFTKVLPLPKWQQHPFYRFLIMTLGSWLIACLLVTHVVIDKNHAAKYKYFFCLVIPDVKDRLLRVIFRELLPAIICIVIMSVNVGTFCLKRSRMLHRWNAGELREVRSEAPGDESEWVRCVVYINVVWLVRAICLTIAHHSEVITSPSELRFIAFVMKIHTLCIYLMPFAVLFIADVRRTLVVVLFKLIHVFSLGKLKFGDDLNGFAVSFGNINATEENT